MLLMEIKASVRHDYPLPTSFFKIIGSLLKKGCAYVG